MKSITVLVTASGAPGTAALLRALRTNGERSVRLVGTDMSPQRNDLVASLSAREGHRPVEIAGGEKLVVRARDNSVGIYPISSLYANDKHHRRHRCAGVILGYASFTVQQIERGVRTLKEVVVGITRDAAPSR